MTAGRYDRSRWSDGTDKSQGDTGKLLLARRRVDVHRADRRHHGNDRNNSNNNNNNKYGNSGDDDGNHNDDDDDDDDDDNLYINL